MIFVFSRGGGPGCNSVELTARLGSIKNEIDDLDRLEKELDQHKQWVQQSIKNVTEDADNHRYVLNKFITIFSMEFCWSMSKIYVVHIILCFYKCFHKMTVVNCSKLKK